MRALYFLIALVFIFACNNKVDEDSDLKALFAANPTSDAITAIHNNDFRFYGVYGYSVRVPEIKVNCINLQKDVKMIEGTTDAIDSYQSEQFNALAEIYASNYNIQIEMYLKDKGLFDCDEDNVKTKPVL